MIISSLLRRLAIALLGAVAASAMLSCNVTRPPQAGAEATAASGASANLPAMYSEIGRAGGRVFSLAPENSVIRIYAFRAGRAARLGHNHVLSAPQFTGFFHLPPGGAANGRFDLEFRLDQLEIDNPVYRSALGAAFSSVLSPEEIEDTRKHLLGADDLQADRFPFVRIHSLQISGEAPKFAARVQIEMHGQKREMWIALDVEGLPDRLSVSGSFVLRQSDFGVQPYSLLGGLLSVQDEVVLDFKLAGACRPGVSGNC
ncbi:MAG TPA: YceI family protein [Burkholderiaceae bacterium]|jgi:polyisoprenoid-binding protein YceI|nr:YceI family protein [Burkholderiaceae bacterium]